IGGMQRQHQLALEYFARARDGAERRHEPSELAFALTVEATYHLGFARFPDAERCGERALELCDGDARMRELTLAALGHVEFYTGRVKEALGRYQELSASARA